MAKKQTKKTAKGEVLPKSGYEPWMCDKILEVAQDGGHVAQMCLAIGIKSRDTFYRWANEYKEFGEAYEASKLYSQAFYENLLLAVACGKVQNANFNALAMTLNNKFPDEYKRSGTGGSNTEINIGSINSIEHLNTEELDQKIKKLQSKLNLVEVRPNVPERNED